MAKVTPPLPQLAAGTAPKALPALDLLHWSDSPARNAGRSSRISATIDSSAFINASDERPFHQPSSRSLVRTNQPAGGVSTISFGANLTLEESDPLQKRCPGPESKTRETTGSRIFDHKSASELPPAVPAKKTLAAEITIPIPTPYNVITEDSTISSKKPASKAEAAKQRGLSGTFFEVGGGSPSVRKPHTSAKNKELEGSNIFGRSHDQYRKYGTSDLNNLSEDDYQENKSPRTNPAGGRSQIGGGGGGRRHYGMQSKRQGRNQKVAELSGNNIFEDEVTMITSGGNSNSNSNSNTNSNTSNNHSERTVSVAKRREMLGNDIFSDGSPVVTRDRSRGVQTITTLW